MISEKWRRKEKNGKGVSPKLVYVEAEVGGEKQRVVRVYGPWLGKTKEERGRLRFELEKLISGCENDKVVCLMKYPSSQVGVVIWSGVAGVNKIGQWMLEVCVNNEREVCESFCNLYRLLYTNIKERKGHKVDYTRSSWHLYKFSRGDCMCACGRNRLCCTSLLFDRLPPSH